MIFASLIFFISPVYSQQNFQILYDQIYDNPFNDVQSSLSKDYKALNNLFVQSPVTIQKCKGNQKELPYQIISFQKGQKFNFNILIPKPYTILIMKIFTYQLEEESGISGPFQYNYDGKTMSDSSIPHKKIGQRTSCDGNSQYNLVVDQLYFNPIGASSSTSQIKIQGIAQGNVGLQALTVYFYPIPDNCAQYEKDNNFNICVQCRTGYFLYNGQCYQNCPPNTIKTINQTECVDISLCTYSKNLSSIFISQYNCGNCEKGYYDSNQSCTMISTLCITCSLCAGYVIDNNQCILQCPKQTYTNGGVCKTCDDPNCLICSKNSCSKCNVGNYLQDGACQSCIQNCSVCSNGNECDTCSDGYYLVEDSKVCTQKCPLGYFLDKIGLKCLKCSQQNCDKCIDKSQTSCQQCNKNSILELNQCVGICTSDSQSKCFNCDESCSTCSGPNSSQCIQCAADYKRYKELCYKTCPDYTFYDENQKQCVDCYDNKNCLQCSSKEQGFCLKCNENSTVLVKGQCLTPCLDTQFRSNIDSTCKDCPINCVKCLLQNSIDDTGIICQKCNENSTVLVKGQCLTPCLDTQYRSNIDNSCKNCPKNCSKCILKNTIDDTGIICQKCNSKYFLFYQTCIGQCPLSFYQDELNQICIPCDDKNCEDCQNNYKICRKCKSTKYLYQDQCQDKCPNGFKPDNLNICKDCSKLDQFPCLKIGYQIQDNGENSALIIFDQKITLMDQYLSSITLYLNGKPLNFQYSLKQNSDNTIKIQLIIDQNIEERIYTLQANFQNYQDLSLKTSYATANVNLVSQKQQPKNNETEDVSQTSQGLSMATKTASQVALASIIPLQITGQFQFIASVIDVSQLIYVMGFANVNIPNNLKVFFDSLKDFKIPFKNYFESMNDYSKIDYKSPEKFKDKDIQGFFLENAGDSISLSCSLMAIHIFLYIIIKMTQKFQKISNFIKKGVDTILNHAFYLDLLWGLYMDLSLGFFLQITAIEEIEYKEEIVNYIICGITLFPLLFPLALIYIIRKEKFPKIVKVVVEDLAFRYYQAVLYARKFIMSFVIVVFQFQPLLQIILLIVWHFVMALIILYKNPYEKRIKNLREFFQSVLFLSGTSILLVFETYDLEEDKSQLFGWITIIIFGIIIVFELGFFIKDMIFMIFELTKKIIILIKSRKKLKVQALSPCSDKAKSQPMQYEKDESETKSKQNQIIVDNDQANFEDKYDIQKQSGKMRNSFLAPPSIISFLTYNDKRNLKNQYQDVTATSRQDLDSQNHQNQVQINSQNQIDTQRIFSSQKLSSDFTSQREDKKEGQLLNIPKSKEQQQSSIYDSSYDIQSHNNSQQVTCEVISPLPRTKRKRKQNSTFSLKQFFDDKIRIIEEK
ncbi:B-box zinc finger protein (macronuclear) [Tetrahymena thermophila SB210]|uniref:B-box zinc finger protein n=1 Tax=Tetrahymena thermophila (strain SB210) TaxID=312017 RepID=W7X7B4_TETTS|nr:B-box zinc finger protein [Tetrahymena thermophila SB210]EWS73247.1 B-box zinc finger protein [Tetrahymena thermophila SB210]|eukprot:XP_012654211.1 B-box zinc finger protein [Tetrahymena thermophila SB210]